MKQQTIPSNYEIYRKMLATRIPPGAIVQKMMIDGLTSDHIQWVLEEMEQDSSELITLTVPPKTNSSKYYKMITCGLSIGAVRQKLVHVDQISIEESDNICNWLMDNHPQL
eukprot:TRINITY_DN8736_c0_g1_i1.p1 TRINITY_DN8736_c0_g1~~TRINITY_DN8736_c0_g1_i1.p1  ORF type:complete len:111 (-),score=19.27 TRINITY_DN8736_c0_g1_i1:65-397(-)